MKFQDIPAQILSIRVKPTASAGLVLNELPVSSVQASLVRPDEFELHVENAVVFVEPVLKANIRRLNAELAAGGACLAQLANPAPDGSIELQIAFFAGEVLEMGDVEVGVDEYVEAAVERLYPRDRRLWGDRLHSWLGEQCCFQQAESAYFYLLAGPAIDDALKTESGAESREHERPGGGVDGAAAETWQGHTEPAPLSGGGSSAPKPDPTRNNSFGVIGDGIRFVSTESVLPDGKTIYTVTRLTKPRRGPDFGVRLARGRLRFTHWREAQRIQSLAKAQMTALTQDNSSYLRKWDEFGDLEGEILLAHAREIGGLKYSDLQLHRAGDDGKASVSVHIPNASISAFAALKQGRVPEVQVVEELPDYLVNEALTFKDFAGEIERQADFDRWRDQAQQKETASYFKVKDFEHESKRLTLATENLPLASGTLVLSLAGEIAQIKRRMSARRAILEGRAANPQLGPLIEEKGKITPVRSTPKIPALTAFVRDKVFRKPPTPMQERAIWVALNTPDIAIIQGPPGTGKTTVIAAILERLNEMADKRGANIKGQVLLTGFQHDAVENMIKGLSVNGIPVPKYGVRSDADEDDLSAFERNLEEWCNTIAAKVRAKNPRIDEVQQETEIRNLCLQYLRAPTRSLAVALVERIASIGANILGQALVRRADILAKRLSREDQINDESARLLDAARRLRIRAESFADDGPERAADALDDLADMLESGERALLDRASRWRPEDGRMPFLADLATLKKALLIRFTMRPAFHVEKENDEVIALAEEAVQRIRSAGYSARDKRSAALAEFLAELESNPHGMVAAVSDYSFAFAATCQQSVNRRMQRQKRVEGQPSSQPITYEYVIVDEAARVSPRDLMVPMVQGKRIILVGDHRQLPHIIDEEVARQMEADDQDDGGRNEADWLQRSMFQYLFSDRVRVLEDGDKWPRRVTLDQQYRMHPVLGSFISRNFYERFDASEQFGSGHPESEFTHDLPGVGNQFAVWLDVPTSKGSQRKIGTSWTRPAEAIAIAQQLRTWMESDAAKDLSFGVISFYKAQAELVKRHLGELADDEKKLRVGTVDSFQGMEFDVVFLSMVRTVPEGTRRGNSSREKQARHLFGHLCLYNRLNVSMSRQKKLLIVAGDTSLLQHELAAEFVPGLVDFLQLCRSQGKILQWR